MRPQSLIKHFQATAAHLPGQSWSPSSGPAPLWHLQFWCCVQMTWLIYLLTYHYILQYVHPATESEHAPCKKVATVFFPVRLHNLLNGLFVSSDNRQPCKKRPQAILLSVHAQTKQQMRVKLPRVCCIAAIRYALNVQYFIETYPRLDWKSWQKVLKHAQALNIQFMTVY